ncbi:MAG: redox-sensitive bicupin YhaK (pirin superfamily) [Oceanicoccus sp.]|jgi:redox-sensitive bicupin YhaK (pirin superfamily)
MTHLVRLIDSIAANDGDGVKIQRIAGRHLNSVLDPFLMIDEINSDNATDYIGGFPEHPHRGFETITYMKAGRMRHRDHMGNVGVIQPGDVQWMTAGKGVIHSEMPEQDSGLLHGFQIWLNLPAAEKMKPAAYRDIRSASITEKKLADGGLIRVIAGNVKVENTKLSGPLPPLTTQPILLDVQLSAHETVELIFETENPILVYSYDGQVHERTERTERQNEGGAYKIKRRQMGIFAKSRQLILEAGESGASFLLLGGRAIKEPIVQHGPFVMNNSMEIEQAIEDYQQQRFV